MSLGLVSPLLNRGVRSRWLASLPGAGTTKMLVIDSSGDTAFQDIPVAAWGSITGTLSAQTDLQNALNLKADSSALANYQPLDSDLTAIASLSTTSFGRSVLTQVDGAAVRSLIGAGTSSFDGAFSSLSGRPTTLSGYGITDGITSAAVAAGYQPLDSDLTSIAALGTTSFGRSLLTISDGTNGQVLTTNGAGVVSWQNAGSGSVAWGSITGTLSSQTDLQSALNGKLSLTGGTLTGGLYFSGAAGARLEMSSQQYTPSNVAINMPWGSGTLQGIYGSNGLVGFASAGVSYFEVNASGLRLASTRSIAMGGTIASPEVFAFSGGSNVWEQRNSTNAQTFRLYNTYTDASNYIRQSLSFTTYSTTVHAQHVVEGAGTGAVNVPFVITPRGTGAFILGPMPDGTATGGNARGQNAVDLQVVKTAASQVASGRYSFTVGYANTASGEGSGAGGYNTSATGFGAFSWGNGCTASGQYGITLGQNLTASGYCSTAFGRANSATAQHTIALGYYTLAWVQGMIAFGSGTRYVSATVGDQQAAILPMLGWSAGPTAIELLANAVDRLTVPTRCAFGFTVEIFGVKNKAGQAAFFHRQGIIKNIAGTTSLTGTIQTVGTDINPASASVSITADNSNDSLKIECTQPTGEFTGATGDSTTDIITLVGHPFVNGDEVCFSSLTGGSGLAIDTKYFVRDVSGNTFKLTTSFVGNTAINFTTDITAGTMDYIWYWHCIVKLSRINFGLY